MLIWFLQLLYIICNDGAAERCQYSFPNARIKLAKHFYTIESHSRLVQD